MTVLTTRVVIIPNSIMPILLVESEFQSFREQLQPVQVSSRQHDGLVGALCSNNHAPSVHQPTPIKIKGNKPITIGHSYSTIAILPERNDGDAPRTIPLDMSRVPTESSSTQEGIAQLNAVLSN